MRNLVKATLKILAVIFMARSLFSLQNLFYLDQFGSFDVMQVVLPFFIWIIAGVLLWMLSGVLAAAIIKNEEETSAISVSIEAVMKSALVIIGLILVVAAVPNGIIEMIKMGDVQGIPRQATTFYPNIIGNIIRLLIGVLLIIGVNPIYGIIKKTGKFE